VGREKIADGDMRGRMRRWGMGTERRSGWIEVLRRPAAEADAWTAASRPGDSSEVLSTERRTMTSRSEGRQTEVRINLPAVDTLVVVSVQKGLSTPAPVARDPRRDGRRVVYRAPEVEDALSDSDG
jgi:hypothetical protein